jgi:hypothetical protein
MDREVVFSYTTPTDAAPARPSLTERGSRVSSQSYLGMRLSSQPYLGMLRAGSAVARPFSATLIPVSGHLDRLPGCTVCRNGARVRAVGRRLRPFASREPPGIRCSRV